MNTGDKKSILIEGDRDMFSSKGAVDRFKRDLRLNDQEKLKNGNYFREGWSYKVLSSNENEIKVKLINLKDEQGQLRVLESDERRKMLKEKIRLMRNQKMSQSSLKNMLKDKVPEDVLSSYMILRKLKYNIPIPSPDEVLSKPEEFKPIVHTMVQSFGMFKGNNNPMINYYRALAKELGLPTTFVPPTNKQDELQREAAGPFIEQLRRERMDKVSDEVDDEMKEIYKSLGIEMDDNKDKKEENNMDDEMKEIYKSLGIQVEEQSKTLDV